MKKIYPEPNQHNIHTKCNYDLVFIFIFIFHAFDYTPRLLSKKKFGKLSNCPNGNDDASPPTYSFRKS